jgi:hypothetical protein
LSGERNSTTSSISQYLGEQAMSKIQINELNNNSELEVLNTQETAEVVGGYGDYKNVNLLQLNLNSTVQQAVGGGDFSSTGNSNYTSQGNYAEIDQ